MLAFKNVTLELGGRRVLENVSFELGKGEFAYLTGRTGAGKSSILRLICADIRPTSGIIRYGEYTSASLKPADIPYMRRKLGVVFQDFSLLGDRTVRENLAFVLKATGWTNKTAIKNRINEVLMTVGLSARVGNYPHQLSGGEQQRTAIARALLNEPPLILADEPTGNLDPEVTEVIMGIFQKIWHAGAGVLFITHERDLIERYPARVLRLHEGRLVEDVPVPR
jgi:cell division transport system ATP-binding protein